MSRKTKFELTPNVLARDLKDKISFGYSSTLLTGMAFTAFSIVIFVILAFNVVVNMPDRIVFDRAFVGWVTICIIALLLLAFVVFMIVGMTGRVSMMKKWERGEFVVLSDRLHSLRVFHNRHGGDRVTYYAVFEKYGSCEINAGDSSDPFVDSSAGDEFYLVAFKSARSRSRYTMPMLAYNKKRYEYREENSDQ